MAIAAPKLKVRSVCSWGEKSRSDAEVVQQRRNPAVQQTVSMIWLNAKGMTAADLHSQAAVTILC